MEVYDWPRTRFVAGFIGTPGMNFIEGRIDNIMSDGELVDLDSIQLVPVSFGFVF